MKTCPQCSVTYPDEYVVCPKDSTRLTGEALWQADSVIRGKYKIVGKIGEGGMASVYKAHHQLLDEVRALKVIKPELAHDEQFVRRFKNEAINTRKLQHANAVRVDDLDIAEDGRPFIAMELVEGESLKTLILRSGPVYIPEAVHIALQVCEALQAAHLLGLVHRDIKPDNIVLVSRRDSLPLVKVLDFGIASLKEATRGAGQASLTLTGTGVVIGTPDYMSPEQAMGKRGEELDGRSDLYSLGIVMYRMLTGELPFKADTTVEMILHHIQTPPKPPQALKPELGIPDSVAAIVMKALEKNREKRFASAALMAQVLRQARENLTVVIRAPAAIASKARAESPAPQVAAKLAATQVAKPAARAPGTIATALKEASRTPTPPVRPASPQPIPARAPAQLAAQKREFSKRTVLWATLALVLVIGWAATIKRRHGTDQPMPESASPPPASVTPAGSPQTGPSTPVPSSGTSPSTAQSVPARGTSHVAPRTSTKLARTPESLRVAAPSSKVSSSATAEPTPATGLSSTSPGRPKLAPWPSGVTQFPGSTSRAEGPGGSRPETRQEEIRQLNDTAIELFQQGEYGRAAQMFRQVLQIAPNNPRAQQGLQRSMEMARRRNQGEMRQR